VKPSLGMWRECHPTFQLTKHCEYRSRHHSVDDLTVIGSAALVALATAGSTNSAKTISAQLLTYGEQPSSVVTLERRYGPRRLRDDDDDGGVVRKLWGACGKLPGRSSLHTLRSFLLYFLTCQLLVLSCHTAIAL